ncbi:carbohydrate kinase family protein [Virgisporangium ochraceum]|uniref:Adenosine kinase n=1 Tax=Virgisporangium ochraceum TaxID=65505 RepID=A0A8J4EDJ7_9ACTN|nr:carbohydrate kinase family protein [Virgisporangium ochraceum]GIJ70663.1 adenosine kinase [Virgisporangium ochraceum]
MSVAVTGSIAVDHLMRFPGRFAEQLVPEVLDKVSLSFLADELKVRDGGVAANIAFGMAQLGLRPALVGAVGHDFAGYRDRLEAYGVDCAWVHTSQARHTARFVCTTDVDMCQIATFYAGAMAESVDIDLTRLLATTAPALVIIGADTPAAMLRHARACRRYPVTVAADPSQQLARMSAMEIVEFVDGADYLLANEYEQALLESKTGLRTADVLDRVGYLVTTLGANGVRIRRGDGSDVHVPAVPTSAALDPTGVGDGFRAGFFSALRWGLSLTDAARVGCLLAVEVLEAPGPQEYAVGRRAFHTRLADAYGGDVAGRVAEVWPARPSVAHR